jgi:uncharacterized protein YecA (UPF0149 family)
MDTSGNIRELAEYELPDDHEIELSRKQARELSMQSLRKRKNWMKNQPCPRGSGKKTKRCCWSKMALAGKGTESANL